MDDLISKQAASGCKYWDGESNFCSLYRPASNGHGRWIFNIDDKGWSWDYPYMCDQCGGYVEKEFDFCPLCGTRMEV